MRVRLKSVETWGRARYGDPCRECGYEWSIGHEDAVVVAIPDRYAALLGGRDASLKLPDLGWTAGAYVCHVTDNPRIWAERLVGAAWGEAAALAADARVVLLHAGRGEQRTADVVRNNAHDALHHEWDIRRTFDHPLSRPER